MTSQKKIITWLELHCRWGHLINSSISMEEVILTSILKGFDQKNLLFGECSWLKLNKLRLAVGIALKFYRSVENGLKLNVRKFWGLIPTFVEEKLQGKNCSPILNRVKTPFKLWKIVNIHCAFLNSAGDITIAEFAIFCKLFVPGNLNKLLDFIS